MPMHVCMYSIIFLIVVCLCLDALSTSVTCQMAGDAADDVTVASILARLQDAAPRSDDAEKLYKLAQALQSKPSRERQGVLRQLCSKAEWNINLRGEGEQKKKTNAAIEQELRTAAMRAYVALRACETTAPH